MQGAKESAAEMMLMLGANTLPIPTLENMMKSIHLASKINESARESAVEMMLDESREPLPQTLGKHTMGIQTTIDSTTFAKESAMECCSRLKKALGSCHWKFA